MQILITETFRDSCARLTPDEQNAVEKTVGRLMLTAAIRGMNFEKLRKANPGMNFEPLKKPRDKNFWSIHVNRGGNIRLIGYTTAGNLLLCYVDHHDKAYAWAERRKMERHPNTGASQLVEIRETVQEIVIRNYKEEEQPKRVADKKLLFAKLTDDVLLGYGIPAKLLNAVRAADEDTLDTFLVQADMPAAAKDTILELATGGHVVKNAEQFQRALDYPWGKQTMSDDELRRAILAVLKRNPQGLQSFQVRDELGFPARKHGPPGPVHRMLLKMAINGDVRTDGPKNRRRYFCP